MFKFNFEIEHGEEDAPLAGPSSPRKDNTHIDEVLKHSSTTERKVEPCCHVSLDELLQTLPESISYSPLHLPSSEMPLLRRDLYDARFQLVQAKSSATGAEEPSEPSKTEDDYVDSETDLIPGLYEGGLKTWEGGVDLLEVLSEVDGDLGIWARGGKILEVGCGTGLPSAYILRSILANHHTPQASKVDLPASSPSASSSKTTLLHLQDFNLQVLSLVTLPNLILASIPFLPVESFHPADEAEDMEDILPKLNQPGEIALTPRLLESVKKLWKDANIELKFTYGPWSGFADDLLKGSERYYDLVMTAETIYSPESVDDLIQVIKNATASSFASGSNKDRDMALETGVQGLNLRSGDSWKSSPLAERRTPVILVAAKVLYFGVGGGLQSFLNRVEADYKGWSEEVKEWVKGVGRKVVRVGWNGFASQ